MNDGNEKLTLRVVPSGMQPKQAQATTIYNKVVKGQKLTDHEIHWGLEFYRDLETRLVQCGPVFGMVTNTVRDVILALERFKRERGI